MIASNAPPLFIIANTPILQAAFVPGTEEVAPQYSLLPQDARALRGNYVHQWGAIWVAGKDLGTVSTARSMSIAIPGRYTIESSTPILIDGARHAPSSVIALTRGQHVIQSAGPQHVILRYGDHLYRPSAPPPGEIFEGF